MIEKVILVSGGNGRLASELKTQGEMYGHKLVCLDHDLMDIVDKASLDRAILEHNPDVFIHCAAILDNSQTRLALETNMVGTVNVVLACQRHQVKLIYISTDYVYPKDKSIHSEDDPLLPVTPYAWTKLGGECAVRTYPNSLIIRGAMCPSPYPHSKAYTDVKKNMIYQDKASHYILKLLDETGVINIGEAEASSLYDFAKKTRPDVQPTVSSPEYEPKHSHLALNKLKRVLNE